jgi:hypothetical protein
VGLSVIDTLELKASQTRTALGTHPEAFGTKTAWAALKRMEQDLARIVERVASHKAMTAVMGPTAQKAVQDRLMSRRVHDAISRTAVHNRKKLSSGTFVGTGLLENATGQRYGMVGLGPALIPSPEGGFAQVSGSSGSYSQERTVRDAS